MKSIINTLFILSVLMCISFSTKASTKASDKNTFTIKQTQHVIPILVNRNINEVIHLNINTNNTNSILSGFNIQILKGDIENISSLEVYRLDSVSLQRILIAHTKSIKGNVKLLCYENLYCNDNNFIVSLKMKSGVSILEKYKINCKSVCLDTKWNKLKQADSLVDLRLAIAIRKAGDDNIHSFRIPGLLTTNKGSLLSVYDARYNSSTDLQGDINIAMNRSVDGGQTWSEMKIIMDMGEKLNLPNNQNGVGDPAILLDKNNNNIWVAGLWAHGHPNKMCWFASKPGLSPKETSQFMLVKSSDDGLSWSSPINITKQIKAKKWQLLLQGPGKGICMKNGTLVFAAQFKDENKIPFSTIIWSKDHGKTWNIGTGAKPNTTEAQLIELEDGSLMLNMRDNRNRKDKSNTNGRAVAITHDMGATWTTHGSSNSTLPESVCMASIIKGDFMYKGKPLSLVLFSNPNTKQKRNHMSIKVSLDDAESWPIEYTTLIDEENSWGYSCLTRIDEHTVGILYESSQANILFQIIKISDLLKHKSNTNPITKSKTLMSDNTL